MYQGEHSTDFEHPGFGGTFYEKADNVRLHGKFEPRFYTIDRVFIESYFLGQDPKINRSYGAILVSHQVDHTVENALEIAF